jgi:hypothetical protein
MQVQVALPRVVVCVQEVQEEPPSIPLGPLRWMHGSHWNLSGEYAW